MTRERRRCRLLVGGLPSVQASPHRNGDRGLVEQPAGFGPDLCGCLWGRAYDHPWVVDSHEFELVGIPDGWRF
jgi:hypothetical protein